MTSDQFAYINKVYWDSFGPSELDSFLDERPPKNGASLWLVKRWIARIFVFYFYPVFTVIQIWGIFAAESHTLKETSFDISLLCHNVHNYLKMSYWLTNLPKVRSFCLDFSQFHSSKHRPVLTAWVLEKESKMVRKLVRSCYAISYANILFWFVVPTTSSFCNYILDLMGNRELQTTYIPRYSPSHFPFNMSSTGIRILVACLEIPLYSIAFVYFQPIDMFFATVIKMAEAQFRILNAALYSMPEELEEFWSQVIPVKDNTQPIAIRLFIEDHQFLLRYGTRLRKFLDPILGCVIFNCITIICNMTIVATSQLREDAPLLDLVLPTTASLLVVLTCLCVFYTFTLITGILKDAEESVFHALYFSKWYEKTIEERKTIVFMQKQAMKARRVRMFSVGDVGRPTFIDGLRMIFSYYNFMQRFK